MISATHFVATKGHYLAIVSTTVETSNPEAEIQVGLDLISPIEQKYVCLFLFSPRFNFVDIIMLK